MVRSLDAWKDSGVINGQALEALGALADMIVRWNPKVNLTGYKSREEVVDLLIGESVAALAAMQVAGRKVLDFGSGAGIPGLVWLICEPQLQLTSLESRQKKVAFQKEVARILGLHCEILHGRFPEDVCGRKFDLIVSRAIRFDDKLWAQGEELLSPGGCFVRFAAAGALAPGWASVTVSSRTTVLIRNAV